MNDNIPIQAPARHMPEPLHHAEIIPLRNGAAIKDVREIFAFLLTNGATP